MARFVVDLGNVKLSDEEHNGIASAIHAAVIGHLASSTNPGLHAATKTLNHAGMGFAAPNPVATRAGKAAVAQTAVAKVAATRAVKAVAAKPAATSRAARKSG